MQTCVWSSKYTYLTLETQQEPQCFVKERVVSKFYYNVPTSVTTNFLLKDKT